MAQPAATQQRRKQQQQKQTVTSARPQQQPPAAPVKHTMSSLLRSAALLAVENLAVLAALRLLDTYAFQALQSGLLQLRPDRLARWLYQGEAPGRLIAALRRARGMVGSPEGRSTAVAVVSEPIQDLWEEGTLPRVAMMAALLLGYALFCVAAAEVLSSWMTASETLALERSSKEHASGQLKREDLSRQQRGAFMSGLRAASSPGLLARMVLLRSWSLVKMIWLLWCSTALFTLDWTLPSLMSLTLAPYYLTLGWARGGRNAGGMSGALRDANKDMPGLWWPYFKAWLYCWLIQKLWQLVSFAFLPGASTLLSVHGVINLVVGFLPDTLLVCLPIATALTLHEAAAANKDE